MIVFSKTFRSAALALVLLGAIGCANRPPALNCAAKPATVTAGGTATINTNAVDPDRRDQNRLSYSWSSSAGSVKESDGGKSAVFDSSGLQPGTYSVTAEVRDRKHTVKCAVDVVVSKDKKAPIASCQPSTVRVTEGSSTTLRVSASDPNNDPLSYSWSVGGRAVDNNQPQFVFGTAGRSAGSHSARVTVTDSDGMTADCEFAVVVERKPNRNPTVTLTVDKTDVTAGDTITAKVRASDPDNDPIAYSWKVDGQARPATGSQLSLKTSGMSGGRHTISVTVTDDRGGSATETKSFSVREQITIQMSGSRPNNVAKAQLDEVALKLQQNPQLRASITGHTDDRGSESGNQKMGQRRGDAAKDYLVTQHSIPGNRISTGSAGESQPVADNKTAEGRSENRRVVVELYAP